MTGIKFPTKRQRFLSVNKTLRREEEDIKYGPTDFSGMAVLMDINAQRLIKHTKSFPNIEISIILIYFNF